MVNFMYQSRKLKKLGFQLAESLEDAVQREGYLAVFYLTNLPEIL